MQVLKSDLLIFAVISLLIAGLIAIIWFIIYLLYMRAVTKDYATHVFDVKKVKPASSSHDKMLRVYFQRQQIYELSAYIILGLAIIVVIVCILIFLFANNFVAPYKGQLTPEHFFLSGLTIRIGVAVMIFFITRVLLKLYRYCLKIANIHLARFDAILFHEHLKLNYKDAVEIFTIHADVGEGPASPSKEAISLLGELQRATNKFKGSIN